MTVQDRRGDDVFVPAADGLRLHARCYGVRDGQRLPVVCLPGLARTTHDFDVLATTLANDPDRARYVVAIDYRGRGESDYDSNPANYTIPVELADLIAMLTALAIERAVFIGTSRGGILAMVLATIQPAVIAGLVLNDIGPVIESEGLARIRGYLGRLSQPKTFEQAADSLQQIFGAQFTKLGPDEWAAFAHRTFTEKDGSLVLRYDPKLAGVFDHVDFEQPLADLWKEFDALAAIPLMVIRGAHSDLLSPATFAAMRARRPDAVMIEVPDQGHAPLLNEPDVISRIAAFIDRC